MVLSPDCKIRRILGQKAWIWQSKPSRLGRFNFWNSLTDWALSVAIEGGVLVLMKRNGGRQNWMASLVANTASYLLLLGMLQLL